MGPKVDIYELSLDELLKVQRELEEESAYLQRENREYRRECHQGVAGACSHLEEVRAEQRVIHNLLLSVGLKIERIQAETPNVSA